MCSGASCGSAGASIGLSLVEPAGAGLAVEDFDFFAVEIGVAGRGLYAFADRCHPHDRIALPGDAIRVLPAAGVTDRLGFLVDCQGVTDFEFFARLSLA